MESDVRDPCWLLRTTRFYPKVQIFIGRLHVHQPEDTWHLDNETILDSRLSFEGTRDVKELVARTLRFLMCVLLT